MYSCIFNAYVYLSYATNIYIYIFEIKNKPKEIVGFFIGKNCIFLYLIFF